MIVIIGEGIIEMRHWATRWLLGMALLGTASAQAESPKLVILPRNVELNGPADAARFLVLNELGGTLVGEEPGAAVTTSNPEVVRVQGKRLLPVGEGQATLTAEHSGRFATAMVTVKKMASPKRWRFIGDVEPVLAKAGCNTGACHGALAGKGGFKLSLGGYDPAADHLSITREARGRRIELADPGRSLLLTKPTGAIAHKGGVRFETDSDEYAILSGWVAQGAPGPLPKIDPHPTHIEVLPAASLLAIGDEQELIVLAHYSNGRVRDVTPWARFSATDESVASVDPKTGRVKVVGSGEGAVLAWFASQTVLARVTVPYANKIPSTRFAELPRANFIDELVLAQLEKLQLPPSPRCTDGEFIRRAFLDTLGVLPTADETRKFFADTSPDKRMKLVDELLSRPEFVDYWTYKWSDVLLVNGKLLRPRAVEAYSKWIRGQVQKNAPWDEMVREIVSSKGSSFQNGATNFYALHQTPEEMCENVSQAFLGLSIACAKCHNHPLEKWTNDQFYSLANMFSRVRAKGWGGDPRNGDGNRTLYVAESGELLQPRTGKPQPPAPLDGEAMRFDDPRDRREVLAAWLTSPENPYFTRAIANRVWANFFGVGLVESVDDLRLSNPASNEPLLAKLAEFTAEQKYDLKQLMRLILTSETYQRSSQALPENASERRYYSRYYPRRLSAEVLLDAVSQVTQVPTPFREVENTDGSRSKTDFYPLGTRAVQLYDSAVVSGFLSTFGRNERAITCECERSNEPTVIQVLQISNGDMLNQKLASENGCVVKHLAMKTDDATLIDEAYLAALARPPTESEKSQLLEILKATPEAERRAAIEDLYWGILSSKEFLFQH